jgi:hypothetical protein
MTIVTTVTLGRALMLFNLGNRVLTILRMTAGMHGVLVLDHVIKRMFLNQTGTPARDPRMVGNVT